MEKSRASEVVYLSGKPLTVKVEQALWKQVFVQGETLHVCLANVDNRARIRAMVAEWFVQQARRELPLILKEIIELHGWRIRNPHVDLKMRLASGAPGLKLSVRNMRSRWGSCSRQGNLSLNSELLHLPQPLIEYVVVHELCHLSHLDHSPAFWFQVASCLPDWRQRRTALKQWQDKIGMVRVDNSTTSQ